MPRKKKFEGPLFKITAEVPQELVDEVDSRLRPLKQTRAQAIAWGLERWLERYPVPKPATKTKLARA